MLVRLTGTARERATGVKRPLFSFRLGSICALAFAISLTACGGGTGPAQPPAVQPPTISLQPQSAEATAGHLATFRVQAQGIPPLSYQWLRNGQPIEGATADNYSLQALHVNAGATIAVEVSNASGRVLSHAATVVVNAPALPQGSITVERATVKPSVIPAEGALERVADNTQEFIAISGSWWLGRTFLFGNSAYKVASVSKTADGRPLLRTVAPEASDVFSDLKYEIRNPFLLYDEAGQAVRADALRSQRMRALARRTASEKPSLHLLPCITPSGEVEFPATGGGDQSEFGYELHFDCSIDKLLGRDDDDSGLRLQGFIAQTGETRVIQNEAEKTKYQEQTITSTGNLKVIGSVVLGGAQLANLKTACANLRKDWHNICQVETKDGKTAIELSRVLLDGSRLWLLPNGVVLPTYWQGGITFKLELSATGEFGATFTIKKFVRAGHIKGDKVLDHPPETWTAKPHIQFTGELDAFIGGFMGGGIGVSRLSSILDTRIDLGGYLNGKVDVLPPCAAVEHGGRVRLSATVGPPLSWANWEPVDWPVNFPSDPWVKPADCTPAPGKTGLVYAIADKEMYAYSYDESTDTADVYQAMHSLVARADPAVPKLIRIDLAGTVPPRGRLLALDYQLVDSTKGGFVNLVGDINKDAAADAYLSIDPGSSTFGDSLSVRFSAYVPGDRAATEVTRTVRLQIEPKLAAQPYYRKRVETDGSETHVTEFVFRGETQSQLKGGYLEYDDGSRFPLERDDGGAWRTSATWTANTCAWFGRIDCRAEAVLKTPTRLMLFSAASKNGIGQEYPVTRSDATTVERLDLTPVAPTAFDILTLKAYGQGMQEQVAVSVPNCRNLKEKQSEGNLRWGNFATDYREFTCETTAPGTDLVAKVAQFPALFNVVTKDCELGQTVWRGDCVSVGKLLSDPERVTVGEQVALWLTQTWDNVKSVVFNFVKDGVQVVAAAANYVSEVVRHVYTEADTFILRLTLRDTDNQPIAGAAEFWIDVTQGPVTVSPLTAIAGQTQTFTVTGAGLPSGLKFNLPGCDGVTPVELGSSATIRLFSCTFLPSSAAGGHDGTVAATDSPFGAAPVATFTVAVSRPGVGSVQPASTTRTLATSFEIAGQNLPSSGITVVPLGSNARASCQAPNNLTPNGFGVACELFTVGAQTLEVRQGEAVLGTVTINVASNVSSVTWVSPSSTNSETVKFGEMVTYTVHGINLKADAVMGFAVEKCGVSNTEVGTSSASARQFQCLFNNEAGATAGLMTGVVKDSPDGHVLFGGPMDAVGPFKVPVQVPTVSLSTGRLPHTGIKPAHCYSAGTDVLVDCTSEVAVTLNSQQDGMRASINSLSYSPVAREGGGDHALTDCVKDNVTGLIWEGKTADGGLRDSGKTYTNYGDGRAGDASAYVAAVNAQRLCGYTDWRLPEPDELHGLVNYGSRGLDATWHPNSVGNSTDARVWSGLGYVGNVDQAWTVVFGNGDVVSVWRKAGNAVRLVRGNITPSQFTLLAGGAEVVDNRTGLIWRRCVEPQVWSNGRCTGAGSAQYLYTHEAALAHATGQSGWRLPSVKELASIMDRKSLQGIDAVVFPGPADYGGFWSSTPYVGASQYAWDVFRGGRIGDGARGRWQQQLVRLVRDPP